MSLLCLNATIYPSTHYLEVCLHALSPAHKVLPAAGTHPAYLRLEAAASAEEVARLALHDPSPGHRTRSLSLENSPRPPLDILLVETVNVPGDDEAAHYPGLQRHLGLHMPLSLQFSELNKTLVSHFPGYWFCEDNWSSHFLTVNLLSALMKCRLSTSNECSRRWFKTERR